ncbi:class I SAM-dependent methyltransferase [Methylobacterium sp. A54F]
MTREATLLRGLPRDGRVIEIGPSYNPLAAKRDGWNAFTVDHASREGLVAKYASDPSVDTARIEEVDFVWSGGSLAEAVPPEQHGSFDAFIASHVIEHTTDVVTFLQAAETLVKPDGVIILALPDKRKCFDFYRHPSTTIDAITAFDEKRSRHDRRTQFEYGLRMANRAGSAGWAIDDSRAAVLAVPFDHAQGWLRVAEQPGYVDAHNWVFVPASFELLVLELAGLGYLDLRVEAVEEAVVTEFYAWLRKGREPLTPDAMQARRHVLMDRIVVELAEQSRQIPGSPLHEAGQRAPAPTPAPRPPWWAVRPQ